MKLPNKPSELIRLALKDLSVAEKKNYIIGMNLDFLSFDPEEQNCTICLAGSVMANTLKDTHTLKCFRKRIQELLDGSINDVYSLELYPADFNKDTANKLYALDFFRIGDIYAAFGSMFSGAEYEKIIKNTKLPPCVIVPPYSEETRLEFRKAMFSIARMLEAEGL